MRADGAKSALRVIMAEALADMFLSTVRECRETNLPLTTRQQQAFLVMTLMTYREKVDDGEGLLDVEVVLSRMMDVG